MRHPLESRGVDVRQAASLQTCDIDSEPPAQTESKTQAFDSPQRAVSGLRIKDVDAILNELAGLLEPLLTHYQWRPQLRDPADEMVLEAAANARVDALVTYKLRDLLPAERFGISVLTPEQTFGRFDLATLRK